MDIKLHYITPVETKKQSLNIDANSTIYDVKVHIETKISFFHNVQPNCIKLIYKGKILEDNQKLEYYNIQNNSVLFAVLQKKSTKSTEPTEPNNQTQTNIEEETPQSTSYNPYMENVQNPVPSQQTSSSSDESISSPLLFGGMGQNNPPLGANNNFSFMNQMLQNPNFLSHMQNMVTNPQMQQMMQQMMQNPERIQQSLQLMQNPMFQQMTQQVLNTTSLSSPYIPLSNNTQPSQISQSPQPSQEDDNEKYKNELEQLHELGFDNDVQNISILKITNGNVSQAINLLIDSERN